MRRGRKYIGMLAYIPLLQRIREDGTSVPKHVGVDICYKWCITECILLDDILIVLLFYLFHK